MEISLLKAINSISSFFHLSSHDHISLKLPQKYYQKIEDILKLLKHVLDAVFDAGITSEEVLQKAFAGLGHSVNELRELFENWHPLRSKIYFVQQVETLIPELRSSGIEIFELLRSSDADLPDELNASSLEICLQKIKQMDTDQALAIMSRVIKEQVEGTGPSSDNLENLANILSLRSNQELLIEGVALEKLKENAEQAEKNSEAEYFEQMIALVTYMHEHLVVTKQSQSSDTITIPADFCCPLSLELMTDPVIVASGQTYERAFIRKWIDLGLTVCPKTRQNLSHTNLIPNYTVKALIANWCESNNVKLPTPNKSLNQHSSPSHPEKSRSHQPSSPNSTQSSDSQEKNIITSSHLRSSSEGFPPGLEGNGLGVGLSKLSIETLEDRLTDSGEQSLELPNRTPVSPSRSELSGTSRANSELSQVQGQGQGHNRTSSTSSTVSSVDVSSQGVLADTNKDSTQATSNDSDASGQMQSSNTLPASEFSPRTGSRFRGQSLWRRPSDRFVPRMASSQATETRPDLSAVETQVKNLIYDLKSSSIDAQRDATNELRLLAKHNMDNRIVISSCGAISLLVDLLRSNDNKIQENAVTALLNLSINDNNKIAIANAGAIEPLIHVLETGSAEAKENSAATLFSLSVIEDNKVRIGRAGAIKPLVELLGNGTPRGKKDASTALFNLSIFHENKARIVQAGAVKYLVELMDPAAGMVDKAVAVLANLATIQEGRTAIGQEGGIAVLVEVVELGSARGKENAAAALLQLCTNSNRFCNMVLQEGAVPPLVALSQSGTARAKEKAQALLSYFRNQRHGNGGRG